jgi:subtilisin family serine protease
MTPLDLVRLTALRDRTSGSSDVVVGLIDGPVAVDHPDLANENIRPIAGKSNGACNRASSTACLHGTFVAGILSAKRTSGAPAICPSCTLLVRPIFAETTRQGEMPTAEPEELGEAILDCIDAGAHVLNVSAALAQPTTKSERRLEAALDYAAKRGVLVIVAAGNQGTLGSTAITRHPWALPVVAYDLQGKPTEHSNLGASIGRRGIGAPGERVTSLGAEGKPLTLGGTSAAAPFVTGTIALLRSEFPDASASNVKLAITQPPSRRRTSVVPPLLDAWTSFRSLEATHKRRRSY